MKKRTDFIKWATAILVLIGTVTSGWVFIDDRFAKAEEVKQQVDSVKLLYIQSERRAVQREKFQIEVTRAQRKLTLIEEQRLEQLKQEEKDLNIQMQKIGAR